MRSPSTRPVVFVLVAALLAALLIVGAPTPRSAYAEEDVLIVFKESVAIEDMLKAVSDATGQALLWDPNDKQIRGKQVMGGVNIRAKKSNVLAAIRSLLTFYELVMIPVGPEGNQMILVMDARRTTSILKLKAEPIALNDGNLSEYEHADGLFVTTMITTQHMTDLRNARNALTRIVTGQNIGNVTEVPPNGFVVSDFAPNVVSIYRLIQKMDSAAAESAQAAPTSVFRAVSLSHASASTLMVVLARLFPPPQAPGPRAPNMPAEPARGPRIQSDERTNQILVTGTQGEVDQVMLAIAAIDVDTPRPDVEAHVIRLAHLNAYATASELSAMIGSARLLWRDQSDPNTRPSVVASQEINALLVSADGNTFERIRRLVIEMDEIAGEHKGEGEK